MAIEQTELVGKRVKCNIDGSIVKYLDVILTTGERIRFNKPVEFTLTKRTGKNILIHTYYFICQLDDNRKFRIEEKLIQWSLEHDVMTIIEEPTEDHKGMIYNKYNNSWSFI